jgi:uncharacterized protein (TIGR01777 family)
VRNALAARKHFAPAAWQRRGLTAGRNARPKTVLMTGATGFIGRHLADRLIARGDRVIVLARDSDKAEDLFGPLAAVVTNLDALPSATRIDAIVNLAGEPIAGRRWNARRKEQLIGSRVAVTEALLALAARLAVKPATWLNASAVGYYGVQNGDAPLHEKSAAQPMFQSELCRRWEQSAERAAAHGIKVAVLRIGLVLGRDGGALAALARPVRWRLGMLLGGGQQWVSWIHVDDLLELFLFVLDEQTLAGPVNATAPAPVRHAELMESLAAVLGRPLLPIALPARLLRSALGELAELFVDGQRVLPARATALGFRFRHATLRGALADLLGDPAAKKASQSALGSATP